MLRILITPPTCYFDSSEEEAEIFSINEEFRRVERELQ